MKKLLTILLTCVMLCLPAWVMAEISINGVPVSPDADGVIVLSENNAVVTGSGTGVSLKIVDGVTQVTLDGVNITAPGGVPALEVCFTTDDDLGDWAWWRNLELLTVTLKGDNRLQGTAGNNSWSYAYAFKTELANVTLTGTGSLTAIGGDCDRGNGMEVPGVLRIENSGGVTAIGGSGRSGGRGMHVINLHIKGSVTAIGGNSNSDEGVGGQGIAADGGLVSIEAGSNVQVTGGHGYWGGHGIITSVMEVESSTVKVTSGKGRGEKKGAALYTTDYDNGVDEYLRVSGDSQVILQGENGAAMQHEINHAESREDWVPAYVEAGDGLKMYEGADESSAALVEEVYMGGNYLCIGELPVSDGGESPAIPEPPKTGDHFHAALLLLAAGSLLCLTVLLKRRAA
ncbi:MAG: hypothetical protein IKK21_09475 [Clostridia bacterium]|nr:hypothetical protein [Clostridia bacterium]